VCAFLLVVEDFHRVVYGAEGVCLFHKVLGHPDTAGSQSTTPSSADHSFTHFNLI
jgi:hypothetical protein